MVYQDLKVLFFYKEKAKHHAVSTMLPTKFEFNDQPFILQYVFCFVVFIHIIHLYIFYFVLFSSIHSRRY